MIGARHRAGGCPDAGLWVAMARTRWCVSAVVSQRVGGAPACCALVSQWLCWAVRWGPDRCGLGVGGARTRAFGSQWRGRAGVSRPLCRNGLGVPRRVVPLCRNGAAGLCVGAPIGVVWVWVGARARAVVTQWRGRAGVSGPLCRNGFGGLGVSWLWVAMVLRDWALQTSKRGQEPSPTASPCPS